MTDFLKILKSVPSLHIDESTFCSIIPMKIFLILIPISIDLIKANNIIGSFNNICYTMNDQKNSLL